MLSKVGSAVVKGIDVVPVSIETDISRGMPEVSITGLADAAVREAVLRIRAAFSNSGFEFPAKRVTINIAPADIRKRGSGLDIAMALGILEASGQIPSNLLSDYLVIGEISLDGSITGTGGVLNITEEAAREGKKMIVPSANSDEAAMITDAVIYEVSTLRELAEGLRYSTLIRKKTIVPVSLKAKAGLDYKDVKGQEFAKRALMIAAGGGHGVLMTGSPASGKSMLAKRLPGILPPLTYREMIKTTKIYSVAGLLDQERPYIYERPFRDPHHRITGAGLLGGGLVPMPGEISLANGGVLFLDELAEFDQRVVDCLREPLEQKKISMLRGGETYTFPCDFMLVAATNPCKCGYADDPDRECTCTRSEIEKYRARISGPIMDRIDMHIRLRTVSFDKLSEKDSMSTEEMRRTVAAVRENSYQRLRKYGIRLNSEIPDRLLDELIEIDGSAYDMLNKAYDSLMMNPRTLAKTKKIARTIADIKDNEKVSSQDVAEALQYSRYGDA